MKKINRVYIIFIFWAIDKIIYNIHTTNLVSTEIANWRVRALAAATLSLVNETQKFERFGANSVDNRIDVI